MHEQTTHRLIRRKRTQASVQPAITKKPSPSRTGVSQPATFGKLDDWRIKTSPKGLKFCRHDHKDLVNISTKGIDESLHGLGGIEEFPSKNGVFLEREKLRFEKTRDSVGFSTRLGGLESLQRVM